MKIQSEEKTTIPDGEYSGTRSGYTVRVEFLDGTYSPDIKVNEGIRGLRVKCKIKVEKGQLYII